MWVPSKPGVVVNESKFVVSACAQVLAGNHFSTVLVKETLVCCIIKVLEQRLLILLLVPADSCISSFKSETMMNTNLEY